MYCAIKSFIVLFLSGYSLLPFLFECPTLLIYLMLDRWIAGSLETICGSDLFLVGTGPQYFWPKTGCLYVFGRVVLVLFFVTVTTVCFGDFQRGEGFAKGVA